MEIQTAKRAWETATEQLELLNHQLAEITQQINTDERSVQQLRQRRAAFDESLEQLNQQLLQVTEGLKQAEGQKEVLLERSKHTQKHSRISRDLDAVSERLQQLNDEKLN